MANMLKMLKDAVLAQKNIKKIQDELKRKTIEFSSADGKVRVIACGDASITGIRIDPAIIDPRRADALEKMVLEAVNGALEETKKASAEHMQQLMSDMGLPNLPGIDSG